jgi:hypothetical protein
VPGEISLRLEVSEKLKCEVPHISEVTRSRIRTLSLRVSTTIGRSSYLCGMFMFPSRAHSALMSSAAGIEKRNSGLRLVLSQC